MQLRELRQLVNNTGDAAYAIDSVGLVVAWNAAAEALFGLSATDVVGRFCCDLMRGSDETGVVCGPECAVQQAVRRRQPVANYDIEVESAQGRQWVNTAVLQVDVAHATRPYSIHIVRSVDVSKRFERLLEDVVVRATGMPAEAARQGISTAKSAGHAAHLSKRQLEVLRLLATGASTKEIAAQLDLRVTTVNNHVGHILDKLDAHSRLEAVRRGQQIGLL